MSRWMLIASEPRRPTERPQSWRICVRQTRAEGVAVSRSESAIRTLSRALGITAAAGVAGECAVRMRTRQGLWSNAGVFVRVWEYEVPSDRTGEFTAAYAADGAWGELFGRAAGFLGTELHRDAARADRFLTIDRWQDEQDWRSFLNAFGSAYESLNAQLEGLAATERSFVRRILVADCAAGTLHRGAGRRPTGSLTLADNTPAA